MADGRIEIEVILDDGSVAKGVANVDKSLSGIEGSAQKASLSIGKIVTALGLVALARKGIDLLKDSISAATQRIDRFEQFERVMTAVTGSTEEANRAMKLTDDIVTGTGYSLDGAAQAVQNFVTRGATIDEATGYVEAWGDAVAFYGDGSEEQFMNVTDALATMRTKGKVDMQQLNRLFEAGIPAVDMYAQATGRSADEVQDALSNGEISAEDFIDTVTTAMMEGTNGVTNINGAAKDMGSSWGSVFANMRTAVARGVANIITSIDEMLDNNGLPTMRDMVAEFGKKFEDVLNKVANAIPKVAEKIMDIYNKMEPWMPLIKGIAVAVGAFITAFAGMQSVIGIINMVRNAIMLMNAALLANPVGLVVAAVIAAVALIYVYWEPISEFFMELWEKVKEVSLAVWEPIQEAWNTSVEWLKETWTGVSDWFVELWEGIKEVFVLVWEELSEVWSMAVESLILIFTPIVEFFMELWGTVQEFITETWDTITQVLSTVWDNIKVIASATWELIKNAILGPILLLIDLVTGDMEGFKSHLSQIWGNIKDAGSKIWNALKDSLSAIVSGLISILKGYWNTLKSNTSSAFDAISSIASTIWNGIKSAVSTIVTGLVNAVKSLWSGLKNTTSSVFNAISSLSSSIWSGIKSAVNSIVSSLVSAVTGLWSGLKGTISSIMSGISSTISSVWSSIKSTATNLVTGMKTSITNVWNNLKNATRRVFNSLKGVIKNPLKAVNLLSIGKDIMNGLINGIKSKIKAVGDAAKSAADAVTGKIKGLLGISSPSKVLMQFGEWTGEGFEKGISSMVGKVEKSADGMAKAALPKRIEPEFRLLESMRGINVKPHLGIVGHQNNATSIKKAKRDNDGDKIIEINLEYHGNNPDDAEDMVTQLDRALANKSKLKHLVR